MNIFTNSSLSTYRLCPRKFYFEYIQRIVYKSKFERQINNGHTVELLINKRHRREEIQYNEDMNIKLFLISQYYNPDGIEIVETDIQPHYEIMDGIYVTGKLDSLVTRNNIPFIMDVKSSERDYGKRGYDDYWKMWEINRQMAMYSFLAHKNEIYHEGIIVNWIKVPKLKQKNRETQEEYRERLSQHIQDNYGDYFVRLILDVPSDYEEIEEEIKCEINQIQMCIEMNCFPRTAENCDKFYYLCPFINLCTGQHDISQYQRREKRHQELDQKQLPENYPVF